MEMNINMLKKMPVAKRYRWKSGTVLLLGVMSTLLYGCGKNHDTADLSSSLLNWEDYDIYIEGSSETDENPWGYSAGIIEVNDIGSCILLTPNTSFEIDNISNEGVVSLQAEIHPWVSASSDGAGIDVWIMNDSNDILQQDSILIGNEMSWIDIQYSFSGLENASKIKFLCNNGDGDDDSADWVIFRNSNHYFSEFGRDGYVRSATYFADEWPINFWNSEMDCLDDDMQQICDDGFDSIIICIPWKEFQTNVSPVAYSDYAFDKLDEVMRAAEKHNLDVYTRIGYTWDYYNDSNESIIERMLDILRNRETLDAWMDYCATMYKVLSKYSNFREGFLTWEDFWGCLAVCDHTDEQKRLEWGGTLGYQKWVENQFELDEYNQKYGKTYSDYADIPVPMRTEPAMEAMYRFWDEHYNIFLVDTQKVFPNISIEVRLDADTIVSLDGQYEPYSHSQTFKCGNSDFTAAMYGIPMGFANIGERVSAEEALNHTEYILGELLNQNSGKPIYVEQFLFWDNTPQFSHNARIKDGDVEVYLSNAAAVLLEYTKGYGIWTYRDYRNNMLYNAQFALGNTGWTVSGNVDFVIDEAINSMVCHMSTGASIYQEVPNVRNHFDKESYKVIIDVKECNSGVGTIAVQVGNVSEKLEINGAGTYELSFAKNERFDFGINVESGDICIDNLCLYSFVQEGYLYNENNEEMEYIQEIRDLNKKLKIEQNSDKY